jgi:hypothetical protein
VNPAPAPAPDATPGVAALVDLDRYPLLEPDGPALAAVVGQARAALARIGAAELPGFLSPAGLEAVVADACALEGAAHWARGPATAYLELPDPALPEGHPRAWWGHAGVGAVAYDQFPAASPLRRLYEWEPLRALVEAVLDRGPIHRYADPLGALNLASMAEGDELQWHFDQTDFVVSLAVRGAAEGGDFEVVPGIRGAGDERYDDVAAVLAGDRRRVLTLPMTPGTLLVFAGRHSLHRVSPIAGGTTRLVALLGYDTQPGTTSSELLKLIRYGRTEPLDAAGVPARGPAA